MVNDPGYLDIAKTYEKPLDEDEGGGGRSPMAVVIYTTQNKVSEMYCKDAANVNIHNIKGNIENGNSEREVSPLNDIHIASLNLELNPLEPLSPSCPFMYEDDGAFVKRNFLHNVVQKDGMKNSLQEATYVSKEATVIKLCKAELQQPQNVHILSSFVNEPGSTTVRSVSPLSTWTQEAITGQEVTVIPVLRYIVSPSNSTVTLLHCDSGKAIQCIPVQQDPSAHSDDPCSELKKLVLNKAEMPKDLAFYQLNGNEQVLCVKSSDTVQLNEMHLVPDYEEQTKCIHSGLNNTDSSISLPGHYTFLFIHNILQKTFIGFIGISR
ncbi:uncharacterized protein LOC122797763 [Protopterus annectens]|uniref:uncharacterized protein LOC122797763 n=1 Tax=Protopterus annectens TaxID=7888 RepID=UPI001CFB47C5|nr:uncharacterized protein LOC122797763 [Protopterus annectens]